MITVHVGSEKVALHVHEGLICAHSPFFKAAMSNSWTEAQARVIELPEDDFVIVAIYLQFLYCRKLFYKEDKGDLPAYHTEINRLTRLYIFGEKIQDSTFTDTIIDAFITRSKTTCDGIIPFPGPPIIELVYANTVETSPLRRLLVDHYAWHANEKFGLSGVPTEYVRDLAVALLKVRPLPGGVAPDRGTDTCIYHQHGDGTPCYKTTMEG